jgi:hypothetical protein
LEKQPKSCGVKPMLDKQASKPLPIPLRHEMNLVITTGLAWFSLVWLGLAGPGGHCHVGNTVTRRLTGL